MALLRSQSTGKPRARAWCEANHALQTLASGVRGWAVPGGKIQSVCELEEQTTRRRGTFHEHDSST